jgi:hypothetical protein
MSGNWKGGDGFEVGNRGSAEARAKEKMEEPLVQKPTNFRADHADEPERQTFPAIYGVDLQARRREKILASISQGTFSAGADGQKRGELGKMLGDRQVMLDDKTTSWLMQEEDRLALMAKDKYFEDSAISSGLFSTPHGLEYLHKIRPQYFKDRRKLAKWVANAQLKLFDLRFNGVHTPQDFDFMYMIQSLSEDQKKILKKPVWLLNTAAADVDPGTWYQPGLFARSRAPEDGANASFAGMGSRDAQGNNTGAGLGLRPEGESFWGGIFGGKAGGNGTKSGFGVDAGFMNLLG